MDWWSNYLKSSDVSHVFLFWWFWSGVAGRPSTPPCFSFQWCKNEEKNETQILNFPKNIFLLSLFIKLTDLTRLSIHHHYHHYHRNL
jgi:hypothetical protein